MLYECAAPAADSAADSPSVSEPAQGGDGTADNPADFSQIPERLVDVEKPIFQAV